MSLSIDIDAHIVNLIQNQPISEQQELQELLKVRGFNIPQATLSRRLKKLNIAKLSGQYCLIKPNTTVMSAVINLQVSDHGLIVLSTHPGSASGVAYHIDQKFVAVTQSERPPSGILGTIAGDDTILVITQGPKYTDTVKKLLYDEFPGLA